MDQGSPPASCIQETGDTDKWADKQRDVERWSWIKRWSRRADSEMSKQEESEKLSRGQQSLVGPWAIRSQGWLLTFELWPIYWLILQGRLSQENNQDQFICIKITCNKTKMTDLKWLLNKFCKGPLVVCLTIRLLGASLCSLIACWLSTLCCYSRRMQNFYYYYYWTAVLMHI